VVEPAIYRHYRDNLYRVLFTVTWADYERPEPDDDVCIYIDGDKLGAVCGHRKPPRCILTVKWSGNPCAPHEETCVSAGDTVVIYVSLSPSGRVSARTEIEFEQVLPGGLEGGAFREDRRDMRLLALLALLCISSCERPQHVARCVERCEKMPQGCFFEDTVLSNGVRWCRCTCSWPMNGDGSFK